nr:MAG TPA: hypothetical protein [Caudoviricetes sp.]
MAADYLLYCVERRLNNPFISSPIHILILVSAHAPIFIGNKALRISSILILLDTMLP